MTAPLSSFAPRFGDVLRTNGNATTVAAGESSCCKGKNACWTVNVVNELDTPNDAYRWDRTMVLPSVNVESPTQLRSLTSPRRNSWRFEVNKY